ncbi:MAG: DUF1501 domain-containing protein [Pirellulales bacterium]
MHSPQKSPDEAQPNDRRMDRRDHGNTEISHSRVANFCDRPSRRRLIQLGGVTLAGLGLPQLLSAGVANAGTGSSARTKSCIFIVQYGGAPHHDTLDPKPDAPREIRGLYQPIATSVPGVHVSEMLPRLAQLAHRYCLVRSMTHGSGGHMDGMHVCLSGQSNSSNQDDSPYFGSMLSKLLPASSNIPSYVWVQNLAGDVGLRYEGGGRLGALYAPLRVGKDLENPAQREFRFKGFEPAPGLDSSRMHTRLALLDQLQATAGGYSASATPRLATVDPAAALRGFQSQALELVTGATARQAFELERERSETRERYGWHPLGQNLLLARRLIEAGVRTVNVTAWCGVPVGEAFRNVQTWDMHAVLYSGSDNIYGNSAYGLNFVLPRLDQAVSTLLEDLSERGLLEDTLVVMVGEFGRTPKFENGDKGRGHWPNAYTALLAGAGIRGGMVYGASDKEGAFVRESPVTPENFGATLYHALGAPTRFPDDISRRVSEGEPVRALFG